jgi:1-acyl-sn-glycerol-3-phosphate acyltransferase
MRLVTPPATSFRQRFARAILALFGWRVVLVPPPPRAILIFYPHTSNWDFIIGIVARAGIGLHIDFVGKDSLFKGPVGTFMRWLGGIPVNRRESTGFVSQLTAELEKRDGFCLAIAPEGTRKFTDHWKSGFYHLALALKVPIGLGTIDYPKRLIGITEYLELVGDEQTDLDHLEAYYADKVGRHPQDASTIRFGRPGERREG